MWYKSCHQLMDAFRYNSMSLPCLSYFQVSLHVGRTRSSHDTQGIPAKGIFLRSQIGLADFNFQGLPGFRMQTHIHMRPHYGLEPVGFLSFSSLGASGHLVSTRFVDFVELSEAAEKGLPKRGLDHVIACFLPSTGSGDRASQQQLQPTSNNLVYKDLPIVPRLLSPSVLNFKTTAIDFLTQSPQQAGCAILVDNRPRNTR